MHNPQHYLHPNSPATSSTASSHHGLRGTRLKRSHSDLPQLATSKVPANSQAWKDQSQANALSPIAALPEFSDKSKRHGHRHTKSLHHHHHHSKKAPGSPETTMPELRKVISRHNPLSYVSSGKRDPTTVIANSDADSDKSSQRWARQEQEQRERGQAVARNEEIWTVFQSISELSMESTKTLDNTYYSILENTDSLKSAVSAIEKLVEKTKELGTEFDRDAKNVKADMEQKLHAFEGFERPKQKIESLESRVKTCKERTEALTARLQAAKDKVKALENQEEEVQASITFQFRLIWAALACILAFIVAILFYDKYNAFISPHTPVLLPSEVEVDEILKTIFPSDMLESKSSTWTSFTPARSPFSWPRTHYDPLDLFEEL